MGGLLGIHPGSEIGFFQKISPALVTIVRALGAFKLGDGLDCALFAADYPHHTRGDVGSDIVANDREGRFGIVSFQICSRFERWDLARHARPGQVPKPKLCQLCTARTFSACQPLGPLVTSNSTVWPSCRLRKPPAWIAEKCTKTSSPVCRLMKPKPLASLNHFTVPCSAMLVRCSFT